MTTTRFLLILLGLLNILFFAASRGWLGFGSSADSSKISIELSPERIKILGHTPQPGTAQADEQALSDPSTGTADPAATCLTWNGLTAAQNNKLTSLFDAAGIQTTVRDIQIPTSWRVVRTTPLHTSEAAEILAGHLGVERSTIQIEETGDGKFLIVLSEPFRNRRGAERHLETMLARGIEASIEAHNTTERRIEATVSKERAEAVLSGQTFARRHKPCPP
jgi:hypothetical protein